MTDPSLPAFDGTRRPDVLVVVMDCVRASDFVGGTDPVRMPFTESLRPRSIVFPRAASVAPWTLPSHASLFTGLYPWEHGCHGRRHLYLSDQYPRLAGALSQAGYSTLSLSANPIIGPEYGLVAGFESAAWGEWWEQVHRHRGGPRGALGTIPGVPPSGSTAPRRRDRLGRTLKTMATRVPATLSLGEAVMRRLRPDPDFPVGGMSPWVERLLSRWLASQPRGRPTFCFINLIDAHEPYTLDPSECTRWREWWASMRIPQDVLALLGSPEGVPPADLARLHTLYRRSLRTLDDRLRRIVTIYQEAGRWPGTLLFLTSDHGQAFGEHGMVWHGVRTDEEMLRVPLWLRLPEDRLGGVTGQGWASPLDILPTTMEALHLPWGQTPSGRSLLSLIEQDRDGPLICCGDGLGWNRPFMERLSPSRRQELDQVTMATYVGPYKIVGDLITDRFRLFQLGPRGPEELPLEQAEERGLGVALYQTRQAGHDLLHSEPDTSDEVDERLRSWGYG
jgi:arylsulfatase A-like enzyme